MHTHTHTHARTHLHGLVERQLVRVLHGSHILLREDPFLRQLLPIQGCNAWVAVNLLVHLRLGERRIVEFVVPMAPKGNQIDNHILAEAHAVFGGDPRRTNHRLGMVRIDMHDRTVNGLDDVTAVTGGAAMFRRRGEAELVVHDEVERPAGRVVRERGQQERFGDYSLTGEGRIAVNLPTTPAGEYTRKGKRFTVSGYRGQRKKWKECPLG